jgi:hypothetical protein
VYQSTEIHGALRDTAARSSARDLRIRHALIVAVRDRDDGWIAHGVAQRCILPTVAWIERCRRVVPAGYARKRHCQHRSDAPQHGANDTALRDRCQPAVASNGKGGSPQTLQSKAKPPPNGHEREGHSSGSAAR